jgi:hypothetical protein
MSTTEPGRGEDMLADFSDWDALPGRIPRVIARAREAAITDELEASFAAIEGDPAGATAAAEASDRDGSARWRGLVGATFAADLACYAEPSDQVSFDRLTAAMRAYPRGFRVWGARIDGADAVWIPLGYTAVIPISGATFARFEDGTASLAGPEITALPGVEAGGSFLYLFNYSVVPSLRGTRMAARVVKALADDVARTPHRGLAALTVSPDGDRVAQRFGMTARPRIDAVDAHEAVFTSRTS